MLKNIIRGDFVTRIEYSLIYYYDNTGGFGFPCDEDGNVLPLDAAAQQNLDWCRQHPEKFEYAGEIEERRITWREPDRGICACGETVMLADQYYGACECPKCGKWYNLFGQELLPPNMWELDPADEEPYDPYW